MKNQIYKITFFGALFLLVSFMPPSKIKYSTTEGKFSIIFPANYKSEDMSTDSYTSIQTKTDFNGQLFFVTYNIHSSVLEDHESLAKTSLNSFSEAMKGTIKSQNLWQVKKNKGLKASIDIPELGLISDYCVVLVGQIQYQVAVVSSLEDWDQEQANAFFKSFKLMK